MAARPFKSAALLVAASDRVKSIPEGSQHTCNVCPYHACKAWSMNVIHTCTIGGPCSARPSRWKCHLPGKLSFMRVPQKRRWCRRWVPGVDMQGAPAAAREDAGRVFRVEVVGWGWIGTLRVKLKVRSRPKLKLPVP